MSVREGEKGREGREEVVGGGGGGEGWGGGVGSRRRRWGRDGEVVWEVEEVGEGWDWRGWWREDGGKREGCEGSWTE